MRELAKAAKPWVAGARVYEAATFGVFTRKARATAAAYETSEYVPELEEVDRVDRPRHEDIQALTFRAASFDLVITSEVFEHVADPWAGFKEVRRVLRRGGRHVFTVPVVPGTLTTRRDRSHPVFHIDPLRREGSLVVTDYGDDLPTLLRPLGFATLVHEVPELDPVLTVFESVAI